MATTAVRGTDDRPRLRVLVVDDSEAMRIFIRARLNAVAAGHYDLEIHTAACGEAAVEHCGREDVDLVLMDVVMPGIGGFEATRQIKAARNVPVAILSSLRGQDEHAEAFRAGCDSYLDKPVREDDLRGLLRQVALGLLEAR